jgi:hypothetical protein
MTSGPVGRKSLLIQFADAIACIRYKSTSVCISLVFSWQTSSLVYGTAGTRLSDVYIRMTSLHDAHATYRAHSTAHVDVSHAAELGGANSLILFEKPRTPRSTVKTRRSNVQRISFHDQMCPIRFIFERNHTHILGTEFNIYRRQVCMRRSACTGRRRLRL